ncbi:MAG: RsmF rRNA methyltransferase first C-terminal domain-containing protein [Clostridia bacterium]|nr:RsmF rRNA methyltransferase first C-terminal domain-containing protein [Clostridia bacterium]
MKNYEIAEKFIERMKTQLPKEEWTDFFNVYNALPHKGIRVNTLKCSAEEFERISPFSLEKIEWEENGFYVEEEKVGGHPYHFAGLFYSQEPSAMSVAPMLEVKRGERVLDLCSAPGGKGTQLASAMQGEGIILLNEPILSRAKILSQNVERMGIKNAVVVSELPQTLSSRFIEYFDKILVDAPCSGEGMFRKNAEEALSQWSEENIALCSERQKQILIEALKMLKKGGRLAYSTCTFSREEDEEQLSWLLENYPELTLIREEKIYPHLKKGEGHYAFVVEKKSGDGIDSAQKVKRNLTRQGESAYRDFEKSFFKGKFACNLHEANGILYELPIGMFEFKGLNVLRAGVRLGEIINGRFEPSHSLAMCVKKNECKNVLDLAVGDARVEKFLRGESIDGELSKGWCLVCVDGYPIGLGKSVNGIIKNHIPKALRKQSR